LKKIKAKRKKGTESDVPEPERIRPRAAPVETTEEEKKAADKSQKGKISWKQIIRLCHIKEPATAVMSILGKRYPHDEEAFSQSGLAAEGEVFDPSAASKRMKIPTPVTWETEISAGGNRPETWENMIRARKLPFMAMLRNIRNMLVTGVEPETHAAVQARLTDVDAIRNSRLFPFRFFSAFEAIKISLEELQKLKDDPSYVPPPPTGKRGLKKRPTTGNKPPRVIRPKVVPTQEIIDAYKEALETAVKIATAENLRPVSGHSVIFADTSGSMLVPISGGRGLGSVVNCMQIGILLAMMLKSVCETCDLRLMASPGLASNGRCHIPFTVQGDNILENLQDVWEQKEQLSGGNEFPYDFFEDAMRDKVVIDQVFMFSDLMICPDVGNIWGNVTGRNWTVGSILDEYRKTVNPNMLFICVDLAGYGGRKLGADLEDDFRNILITGYSDHVLSLISEVQTD
jgi:telomerase protein component 1